MLFSPLLEQLIQSLRCLPGVGPKSAQRMALHLVQRQPERAKSLADTIHAAIDGLGHCQTCNTLSEDNTCALCRHPKRDPRVLCIVESPVDILAIEQTGSYQGLYFVLHGHLSPLDGIGPEQIGLNKLFKRLKQQNSSSNLQDATIQELILATNPTVEGEATAHYIAEMCKNIEAQLSKPIRLSRIAHGVPIGGELEYIDGNTLARALSHREQYA